jgi:hypothetical protein
MNWKEVAKMNWKEVAKMNWKEEDHNLDWPVKVKK